MHVSCLPSSSGIGDFGFCAYKFIDYLAHHKQSFWQILPLNYTDLAQNSSPYSSVSSFALNPLFISPDLLLKHDFLHYFDLKTIPEFPGAQVDYIKATQFKLHLLDEVYDHFKNDPGKYDFGFDRFCGENYFWLEDFSLFAALKKLYGGKAWQFWPQEIRDRDHFALHKIKLALKDAIEKEKLIQYLLFKQWGLLKEYANKKGIKIIGDLPIYVNFDSADVWANPHLFKLDENKNPIFAAGVPPDYFSPTGQYWGNPVYNWEVHKQTGFNFWIRRFEHNFNLYDIVRIDHFRGLIGFWEIPAHENTAVNGHWRAAPAEEFFDRLKEHFTELPIVVEDLGVITDDVRDFIRKYSFPGMKVLLFAFGEDDPLHPYLPQNYQENCVVYTGTHDTNTVRGWFENDADEWEKDRVKKYLGIPVNENNVSREFIKLAMRSKANLAIIPMQDILGLGAEARMNHPSTTSGNWQWRLLPEQLAIHNDFLLDLTRRTKRG